MTGVISAQPKPSASSTDSFSKPTVPSWCQTAICCATLSLDKFLNRPSCCHDRSDGLRPEVNAFADKVDKTVQEYFENPIFTNEGIESYWRPEDLGYYIPESGSVQDPHESEQYPQLEPEIWKRTRPQLDQNDKEWL